MRSQFVLLRRTIRRRSIFITAVSVLEAICAVSKSAAAQLPCASGVVSTYLAPGYTCLLGGLLVSDVTFGSQIYTSGSSGTSVTGTDANRVNVSVSSGPSFVSLFFGSQLTASMSSSTSNSVQAYSSLFFTLSSFTQQVTGATGIGYADARVDTPSEGLARSHVFMEVVSPSEVCYAVNMTVTTSPANPYVADGFNNTPGVPCDGSAALTAGWYTTVEVNRTNYESYPFPSLQGYADAAGYYYGFDVADVVTTPEPSTLGLLVGGVSILAGFATRRKRLSRN